MNFTRTGASEGAADVHLGDGGEGGAEEGDADETGAHGRRQGVGPLGVGKGTRGVVGHGGPLDSIGGALDLDVLVGTVGEADDDFVEQDGALGVEGQRGLGIVGCGLPPRGGVAIGGPAGLMVGERTADERGGRVPKREVEEASSCPPSKEGVTGIGVCWALVFESPST